MEPAKANTNADVCHRCLEPVPPKVMRCPKCGEPVRRASNLRKMMAVFALLMFVCVVVLAVKLMQSANERLDENRAHKPGAAQPQGAEPKKGALGQ